MESSRDPLASNAPPLPNTTVMACKVMLVPSFVYLFIFMWILGNLNSGPHVCVAGTLLTESLTAPAPSLAILFALLGAWFPSYYPRLNILQWSGEIPLHICMLTTWPPPQCLFWKQRDIFQPLASRVWDLGPATETVPQRCVGHQEKERSIILLLQS